MLNQLLSLEIAKVTWVCSAQYTSAVLPSFFAKPFLIGIYGLATIDQIKDAKHIYRVLEAYFSLYFVSYRLHMRKFIDDNQETEKELKESVINTISDVSD